VTAAAMRFSEWDALPPPEPAGRPAPGSPPLDLLAGDRSVTVTGVLPGGVVDVFVGGVHAGSARSCEETIDVPIDTSLEEGQEVTARQRLCLRQSNTSTSRIVAPCRGLLRVGLKALSDDGLTRLWSEARWMRRLFRHFGLNVDILGEEVLDVPHLDTFTCGATASGQFAEISGYRNGLADGDIAIYLVGRIVDGGVGCAERGGRPAAVVDLLSDLSSAAHEVGHVLGLGHTGEPARLMFGSARMAGSTPELDFDKALTSDELATIDGSRYRQACG
jgi:hypothetical protein